MSIKRIDPYTTGEIAEFRTSKSMFPVVAPNGMELNIPVLLGKAEVWLAMPGIWNIDGKPVEVIAETLHAQIVPDRSPIVHIISPSVRVPTGSLVTIKVTYRDPDNLSSVDPELITANMIHLDRFFDTNLPVIKSKDGLYEIQAKLLFPGRYSIEVVSRGSWASVARHELEAEGLAQTL